MTSSPSFSSVIRRALKRRCPRCGQGKIFSNFYRMHEKCPHCDLIFIRDSIDILVFMYTSTALITGIALALLIWVFPVPENLWLARGIMLAVALAAMVLSSPHRKALAIALDYWTENHWN